MAHELSWMRLAQAQADDLIAKAQAYLDNGDLRVAAMRLEEAARALRVAACERDRLLFRRGA